jgi:hypothetical protein
VPSDTEAGALANHSRFKTLDEAIQNTIKAGQDFEIVDRDFQEFHNDSSLGRSLKINLLWELAKKFQGNVFYEYIVDNLTSLYPIELSGEIIRAYKDTKNEREKIKLLHLLIDSTFQSSGRGISESELDALVPHYEEIQNFLIEQVSSEHNPDIKEVILGGVAVTLPSEQAYEVLEKERSRAIGNLQEDLANKIDLLRLEVAISNEESQRLYLQKTLDSLRDESKILRDNDQAMAVAMRFEGTTLSPSGRDALQRFLPAVEAFYDNRPSDAYAYLNMASQAQGFQLQSKERSQFLAKRLVEGSRMQKIAVVIYEESDVISTLAPNAQERIITELAQAKAHSSKPYPALALQILCEKAQGEALEKLVQAGHCT